MQRLFTNNNLFDRLQVEKARVRNIIENLSEDDFNQLSNIDYKNDIVEKYSKESIILNTSEITYSDAGETNINIQDYGVLANQVQFRLKAHIPYTGNKSLFHSIPQNRRLTPIMADIYDNEIIIENVYSKDEDKNVIEKKFQRNIDDIQFHLNGIKTMVEGYNEEILRIAESTIETRKSRISSRHNILKSLDLPMRREEEKLVQLQIPIKRKKSPIKTEKPQNVSETNYNLADEEYKYILDVLHNMTLVMERTPKVFQEFSEENIRDVFLVVLNGHYKGGATGETFNNEGKTDILIRYEGRNIFIAECKFWDGAKHLTETIDQLTEKYITWRDSKAAILVFNRNKGLSSVISQIPTLCRNHPCYLKDGETPDRETEFHFIAKHKNDPERQINIAVLTFDIPGNKR